jgi:hypothetical protein
MAFNGRNRLLILGTLAALAFSGWRLPGSSTNPENGLRTQGPMKLSLAAGNDGVATLTSVQREGRSAMFSRSPTLKNTTVGQDRFWRITNAGQNTIRCYAYGAGSPIYRVEVQAKGHWAPLPIGWSSSGGVIMLKSGQTLCFPALTPTAAAYRIGIRYEEVVIPETIVENALSMLQKFFLPEKSKGEWFLAYGDVLKS